MKQNLILYCCLMHIIMIKISKEAIYPVMSTSGNYYNKNRKLV